VVLGDGVVNPSPPRKGSVLYRSSPIGVWAEPWKILNLVQLETSKFTTDMPYNVLVIPMTTESIDFLN